MRGWRGAVRLVAAGILGYAVIVLLTTLGFVGWLDDANLYAGDAALKARGLLVTLVAGVAGGALAGRIGKARPVLHATAVLPLLGVDTAYVLFVLPLSAPLWFEAAGAGLLMASTLAGGWLVTRWRAVPAPRKSGGALQP